MSDDSETEEEENEMKNMNFDKEELVYIMRGLYGMQQSYGGGYFPHEDKAKYKHFKNVRSIIEKIESVMCSIVEDEEVKTSECCGKEMHEDYDLCPKCLEHT